MINYKDHEAREIAAFDIQRWKHRQVQAIVARSSSGWDLQAQEGNKIRRNELPLNPIKALPGYTGKHYVHNWLWISIKYLVAMQTGASIDIDLKSYDGNSTNNQDILETEINFASEQFNFMDTAAMCQYDRYYLGYGIARAIWNTRAIRPNYHTGTPSLEYVDPQNVSWDPSTRKPDMSDCRYIFHVDWYDIEMFRELYPKHSQEMIPSTSSDRAEANDLLEVVTLQYKKTITNTKIYIEDAESGTSKEFLYSEWQKYVQEAAADPSIQQAYAASDQSLEYAEWLDQGMFLPEKVYLIGPVDVDEDAYFQVIYLPRTDVVLSPPQYIGRRFSYFRLPGYHEPGYAYPVGLAHYMKDSLELSIALMTILMVNVSKMYLGKEMIQEGSLANEEEYKERGHEVGVQPVVNDGWQKSHPGVKAVEPVQTPDLPASLSMLNDQLVNIQKTMSGAVDVNMGLSSYSGESGVKVAQLQAASRVYLREDIEGFRLFITQIHEWLKDNIVSYRSYPHRIQGLDDMNRINMIDVNTDPTNSIDGETSYIEITIQENQEVVKQIEKELVLKLYEMGLYSDIDLLRKLDIPNPEKVLDNARASRGEKAYLEIIQANPEIKQMLDQFIAGVGAGANVQTA
mgnify:FL=1